MTGLRIRNGGGSMSPFTSPTFNDRSAPAQKAGGVPVMTTAPMASSVSQRRSATPSADAIAGVSAFC